MGSPKILQYVDDIAICVKDPQAFCDTLNEVYKLKLKDVEPQSYHLGCHSLAMW